MHVSAACKLFLVMPMLLMSHLLRLKEALQSGLLPR